MSVGMLLYVFNVLYELLGDVRKFHVFWRIWENQPIWQTMQVYAGILFVQTSTFSLGAFGMIKPCFGDPGDVAPRKD